LRYQRHDLHGLLVIDKPIGLSSMEVVRRVRKAAGFCKTGHAGTLDPLATGVLVVCLGQATRCVDRIMGQTKIYEATVDLSAYSHTDDAEGPLTPVPVADPPGVAAVRAALDALTGMIQQTPPAHSAIKIAGRRAYDLARAGKPVDMPARVVRIDGIDLLDYHWPRLRLIVTCGKGTYIRSLARQIGQALGTGGYLASLRRTAVGDYRIDQALSLDHIPQPLDPPHLMPMPQEAPVT
jgi:tRNA pseudouridine55 synthase